LPLPFKVLFEARLQLFEDVIIRRFLSKGEA